MDWKSFPKSKNFEDHSPKQDIWADRLSPMIYRLLFPAIQAVSSKKLISPERNDEFIRRNAGPVDFNATVDYSPKEWDYVRNRGFTHKDIITMREFEKRLPLMRRK